MSPHFRSNDLSDCDDWNGCDDSSGSDELRRDQAHQCNLVAQRLAVRHFHRNAHH